MAVGVVLLPAAAVARDEGAGDRRDDTAGGNQLLQELRAEVQASAEELHLRDVSEVLVRDLVRMMPRSCDLFAFASRPVVT